jgi:hypothetical protein
MPKVTTITGGTAEFFEGIAQREQGCKATYTRGNITFYILVDYSVTAFYRNEVKIGDPIQAVQPGTKGRIEKREENGQTSYVLVLEEPNGELH